MQGTGTAADRVLAFSVCPPCKSTGGSVAGLRKVAIATSVVSLHSREEYDRAVSVFEYAAMGRNIAIASSGGDVYGTAYSPVDRATAAESAIRCFTDDSWDREPRVTETPKRPRVWLPVIQPEAKPLRDRKRLLARRRK